MSDGQRWRPSCILLVVWEQNWAVSCSVALPTALQHRWKATDRHAFVFSTHWTQHALTWDLNLLMNQTATLYLESTCNYFNLSGSKSLRWIEITCDRGVKTGSLLMSESSLGHWAHSQSGCDDALLWALKRGGGMTRPHPSHSVVDTLQTSSH